MLHRVLVADDSEPVQKAIQIALQPYDVEIFEASSFVEALNICKKKSPNLIIADASLTGTDAPKEFKIMSNTAGEVPVLLLEGSFEPIDKDGFEAIGLQCFLKKPFNIEEIEEVIKVQMQISLPVKKQKGTPDRVEDIPPPPPPSRPANSAWENQLVESDLQLDLSIDSDFLEAEVNSDADSADLPILEASQEVPKEPESIISPFDNETEQEAQVHDSQDHESHDPDIHDYDTHDFEAHDSEAHDSEVHDSETHDLGDSVQEKQGADIESNRLLIESLIPALQQEILPLLKQEVEDQVKKAIIEYCELHFKRLARDVIKEELRSLVSD
ncbi:MAG: response regulator [Oligoflexales bacterium]